MNEKQFKKYFVGKTVHPHKAGDTNHYGMTLREYYIGQALQGLLAGSNLTQQWNCYDMAEGAINIVDELLSQMYKAE